MKPVILVIDDNEPARRLARDVLGAEGYEVRCAESGEAALVSASEVWPDLVLLDIQLPGIDGIETIVRLRALAPAGATALRVVVLTASANPADRAKLTGVGLDICLSKPCPLDLLRRTVKEQMVDAAHD